MSQDQRKKLFFGLFVTSLILALGFSIYPTPKVNALPSIWDSCQSISAPERYWSSGRAEASLRIDTSIKSPLGTGSIRVDIPATSAWDLYVVEWFSTDANLLKDFTVGRPSSVYVKGSRALDWRIEIVTREPSGTVWNTRVVARRTVQANTMTEIQLDFSGVSSAALKMVAAVNVIALVNQQSFTGY
ncbi:hypothetical protein MUP77_13150, partial [Candidatus Bathyarchaeota archaeon]|nr:hypothetical protein [Candidatus Bathyarchaeota archaeon]